MTRVILLSISREPGTGRRRQISRMIRQPEGGFLLASVGGLLVERDGRALLIDAGAGPLTMGPPLNTYGVMTGGALLDNLAALGRGPADIEAIALTHLHADHVGWAWHPA